MKSDSFELVNLLDSFVLGIIDLAMQVDQMDSKIKQGPPTAIGLPSSSSSFSSPVVGSQLKVVMSYSTLHRYQTVATRCFAKELVPYSLHLSLCASS